MRGLPGRRGDLACGVCFRWVLGVDAVGFEEFVNVFKRQLRRFLPAPVGQCRADRLGVFEAGDRFANAL